ncbi:MAG: SDR family oxidoreductase [Pirellula sp.]
MQRPFVAVVTGASSGIGQAIAVEFAKRNSILLVHARQNIAGLSETINLIETQSKAAEMPTAFIADIADLDSSRSIVEAAFGRHGYVDAWINCAGADVLTGPSKYLGFAAKLEKLWEVDVRGTMALSRAVAERMLQQSKQQVGGRLPSIVHIGWDQAEHGMEGDSGQYFSAVKSAVAAFSKSLAKSVAPLVRVNCVAPGWVQTEWGQHSSEAWQQRAKGESMLGRWGTTEDIARVVASISFEDGAFINGQTISVNGGWQSMFLSARSETKWDR